jgi:hypothetical protein
MAVRDVRMELIGANGKAAAEFDEPTGGIGSSGPDLVYYGNQRDVEYDFVVRSGGCRTTSRCTWIGTANC